MKNKKISLNIRKIKKQAKGITLIALVVTIIVLLILAGIALNLTIGQNGIFSRAEKAANTWRNAETNEQLALGELGNWIGNYLGENGNSGSGDNDEPVDEGDTTAVFAQLYKNEADGSEMLVLTNTNSYRESGLTYETSYDITNEYFNANSEKLPPWIDTSAGLNETIKTVKIINEIKPKYTSLMFMGLSALENIYGIENLNTKDTVDMSYMFYYCTSLNSLNLSNFDTSNVISMEAMFAGCNSLNNLNLNNFNTSNVTSMVLMFGDCTSLTELDLNSFNTSKVIIMDGMFSNCKNLNTLKLSNNFDTSNVISMNEMFKGCISLTELDLSSFNTSNVTSMISMFNNCASLIELDLSSFNTGKVSDMSMMFSRM